MSSNLAERRYLTTRELAEVLRYRSAAGVRMLIARGKLRPSLVRGRTYLFDLSDVERMMRSHGDPVAPGGNADEQEVEVPGDRDHERRPEARPAPRRRPENRPDEGGGPDRRGKYRGGGEAPRDAEVGGPRRGPLRSRGAEARRLRDVVA